MKLLFLYLATCLTALAACVVLGGCPSEGTEGEGAQGTPAAGAGASEEMDESVAAAVSIARAVRADPASAEAVLRQHGMTVEEYEGLMYRIAADPELSEAFEDAME